MTYRQFLILTMLIFSQNVSADMFGISESGMLMKLQAMYKTMIETLNEAKTQNQQLSSVKTTLNGMIDTNNEVENFDADRIARRISNDLENVTQMDDLSGMSESQRIRAIQRMLDRRIADPDTSAEERQRLLNEQQLLDDIQARNEILELIESNSANNLQRSSTDLSERDSSRISAESLAALSQIEAQRALVENKNRMESIHDNQSLHNLNQESMKIMQNTEKEGW
ncbi:MAG: hypothetical protein GY941_27040 [Planctomycetes bacterium]|nr:hypothetical protein [Planctomycetota bacterium]